MTDDIDLNAALARTIWGQPEAAFRAGEAEDAADVFATTEREPAAAPIGGHRYARHSYDEAMRDVRTAAAAAREVGATQREVIDFLLLGYRGLLLPGANEKRLASILGAIWADADAQREERS